MTLFFFVFQAEDGIRDLVRSRGLGDVYKRQTLNRPEKASSAKPRGFSPDSSRLANIGTKAVLNLSLIHI